MWRLCRKNAKALQLGMGESERLAAERVAGDVKAVRLVTKKAHIVHHLAGFISSDSGNSGTTSTDDDDAPSATVVYYRLFGDRKGNSLARKW